MFSRLANKSKLIKGQFSTVTKTIESTDNKTKISYKFFTGLGTLTCANVVYASLRAKGRGSDQNDKSFDPIVRTIGFWFGLPFTVIAYACIQEGSDNIFGLDLKFMDKKENKEIIHKK